MVLDRQNLSAGVVDQLPMLDHIVVRGQVMPST